MIECDSNGVHALENSNTMDDEGDLGVSLIDAPHLHQTRLRLIGPTGEDV